MDNLQRKIDHNLFTYGSEELSSVLGMGPKKSRRHQPYPQGSQSSSDRWMGKDH